MKALTYMMLVGLAGGCGDEAGSPPGESPDAPAPDAPGAKLAIRVTGAPKAVAYRLHTGTTWQALDVSAGGAAEVALDGPYHVVVACEKVDTSQSISTIEIVEYIRTPADGTSLEHTCDRTTRPYRVRGQMSQSGIVALGSSGVGQTTPEDDPTWSFMLPATAGTFDLVALFGALRAEDGFEQIALRRNVTVTGDLDLGTIDPTSAGAQPLVPRAFTATNLRSEETQEGRTTLYVNNTSFAIHSSPSPTWNVKLAPASLLQTTDRQRVTLNAEIDASSDGVARHYYRGHQHIVAPGEPTTITLRDPLATATLQVDGDRLIATWSSLAPNDEVRVARESISDDFKQFVFHEVQLSASFVATTGATTATVDPSGIPGFQPAWRIDPALLQFRSLDAVHGDSIVEAAGLSESVPAATSARTSAGSASARTGTSSDWQSRHPIR